MIKHKRVLAGTLTLAAGVTAANVAPSQNEVTRAAAPSPNAGTGDQVPLRNVAATESAGHGRPADHERLRDILRRLTTVDGAPGAFAEVRGRRGSAVLTSGVANVESQAPMRRDSRFRIGSMTKPFVATVVLQLVGERRVALDAPVERYLPGVVRGHGNDGRTITVRQLLQHTSGLPDFLRYLDPQTVVKDPLAHEHPRDLLKLALSHPPTFEPGIGWRYSNTGYLLAGMIIEKVTGRTYGQEIRRRIIKPLGLRETHVPGESPVIPGPHPRGYARPGENAPLIDITAVNPSVGGASSELISSGTDLNLFFAALVRGRLLRPAQLREMMRTRLTGNPDGTAYGLGLESRKLPCGGRYWGHTGDFPGFETAAGVTVDGRRAATVMANLGPGGPDAQSDDIKAAVQAGLCEGRR